MSCIINSFISFFLMGKWDCETARNLHLVHTSVAYTFVLGGRPIEKTKKQRILGRGKYYGYVKICLPKLQEDHIYIYELCKTNLSLSPLEISIRMNVLWIRYFGRSMFGKNASCMELCLPNSHRYAPWNLYIRLCSS